jgi:hypothetical protein
MLPDIDTVPSFAINAELLVRLQRAMGSKCVRLFVSHRGYKPIAAIGTNTQTGNLSIGAIMPIEPNDVPGNVKGYNEFRDAIRKLQN